MEIQSVKFTTSERKTFVLEVIQDHEIRLCEISQANTVFRALIETTISEYVVTNIRATARLIAAAVFGYEATESDMVNILTILNLLLGTFS